MGEARRFLAAKAGLTDEQRREHLREAEECDNAVMAGSTLSSGKYGSVAPCEMAVCSISWRLGEAAFKEAKYQEAIGHFILTWEIARNPASDLGGNNAQMMAGALYW